MTMYTIDTLNSGNIVEGKNNEASDLINAMDDVGKYMAFSYFHGYLKLLLPSTGTQNKGLIEKIENFEDMNNIKIDVHKLFILIPSSAFIPPDLKEASSRWMESALDLEDEIRNRAGVKRRTYHNTVYKIFPNGNKKSVPVYVVAEGASPLLTFYEIQKQSYNETKLYQKHGKEIIKNFYEKLKELLYNDPEYANLCELVYYEDNNNKVNVAKIILERISKIKEAESANDEA